MKEGSLEDDACSCTDDKLISLPASAYEAESVLQGLIAHHAHMQAGYQMSRDDPRRFLLIRVQAPIPDRDGGRRRWSVDHLFLDQDAIPTLVEVKRGADSRIRREVVGQMLDYAANRARYWADGTLRHLYDQPFQGANWGSAGASSGEC
jgi:hypothetical protein